jgi:hypothetical protein
MDQIRDRYIPGTSIVAKQDGGPPTDPLNIATGDNFESIAGCYTVVNHDNRINGIEISVQM